MKKSFLYFVIIILTITTIIIVSNQKEIIATSEIPFNEIKEIFPEAEKAFKENENLYVIESKEGKKLGKIIDGRKASENFYGYAGHVPLIIGLTTDNKIIKLAFLENNETPSFFEHVKEECRFDKWNGLTTEKAVETKVDAVTGATMSSSAIINTVQKALNETLQNKTTVNPSNVLHQIYSEILMIPLLLFALFTFFHKKANKYLRRSLMILTIAISGFFYAETLSLAKFSALITDIDSIFLISPIYILMLTLAIILPFITGRNFYCYHLCPFGAIQEITSKIKIRRIILPKISEIFFKTVRFGILLVAVIVSVGYFKFDISMTEPFAAFAVKSASVYVLLQASVIIIISIFIPRFWCRYLCPTGFLINCCCIKRKKVKKAAPNP